MNWYKTQIAQQKKKDGAGILFVHGDKILLGKRSENVSNPGTWSVPGGKISKNDKSFWETAMRETIEEIGAMPENFVRKRVIKNENSSGRQFITYVLEVDEDFTEFFTSNDEFDELGWFSLTDLPEPMHSKTLRVIEEYRSTHN